MAGVNNGGKISKAPNVVVREFKFEGTAFNFSSEESTTSQLEQKQDEPNDMPLLERLEISSSKMKSPKKSPHKLHHKKLTRSTTTPPPSNGSGSVFQFEDPNIDVLGDGH